MASTETRPRRLAKFAVGVVILSLLLWDLVTFALGLLPTRVGLETLPRVDVIVVLTGGRGRLKEAVGLLGQGKSDNLFISGVEPGVGLRQILEANQITGLEPALEEKIHLGRRARSTSENALEISEHVATASVRSMLLVTSTYHMKRARELVERAFDLRGLRAPEIYPFPVETPNFDRSTWWQTFTGWRVLMSEYLKTWALRLGLLAS